MDAQVPDWSWEEVGRKGTKTHIHTKEEERKHKAKPTLRHCLQTHVENEDKNEHESHAHTKWIVWFK